MHLDPSIYLMDEVNQSPSNKSEMNKEKSLVSLITVGDDPSTQIDINSTSVGVPDDENGNFADTHLSSEGISGDQMNKFLDSQETIDRATGDLVEHPSGNWNYPMKKGKYGAEPIIIPIALKMAEFDHKAVLEEWTSMRMLNDKCKVKSKERLIANLKTIQDYLCSFESQGLSVVNISATTFPQTLDWLHGYLLQRIEQGIPSDSSENSRQHSQD